ncbi:glycoside hydrolase family 32 protein [Haloterrigena gelatinilytica]|nr:glycoside hydrolase family 32 protein [Haloterrigena gelatinilytica]
MDQNSRSQMKESSELSRRRMIQTVGAGLLSTVALGSASSSVSATESVSEDVEDPHPWRPEYHFSPSEGWMNDPNGLVYHEGIFHLFYQAGADRRRWAHATSTDLINWTEHGTKVPDTESMQAFSGGAVIDTENTAGFGEDALVAMYTGHHDEGFEDQRIAYSTDNGETVHNYAKNPVIESDEDNFRDPKPFWYEPDESWRMVVGRVEGTEDRPAGIEIYSSENLLDWTYESTYEDEGDNGWECPSLFEHPVEGTDETKWIIPISPIELRSVEYHIGDFDGTEFIVEEIIRADYGYDFYATQRWGNAPDDDGLNITWMGNWEYAMDAPDPGWQGAMTIPRTITLRKENGSLEVLQHPAKEITKTRQETLAKLCSERITPGRDPLEGTNVEGRTLEIDATIDPQSAEKVGLRVREGEDQQSVVTYDAGEEEELRFNRSNSGEFFEDGFYDETTTSLERRDDGTIKLHVLVDRSSVEIFANDGQKTMTNLIYPDWESTGVSLFSENGSAQLEHLVAYDLCTTDNV